MKVLLVIAHPRTDKSFNHAIAQRAIKTLRDQNHEVRLLDLYAEHFDPVLLLDEEKRAIEELPEQVQRSIEAVREADGLVIVHPNWWGTPPAILKGWIDRVFRVGFAYKFSEAGVVSLFTEKTVQVLTTSNTPREVERDVYHDPLINFWETIVFGLVGSRSFGYRNFESIVMSQEAERIAWLDEVEKMIHDRFADR